MNVLPCGDRAVLIDCDTLDEAHGWYVALAGRVDEAVLGARTVLLRGAPADLRSLIGHSEPGPAVPVDAPLVEVPVTYDGEDLTSVAESTGLTTAEVVAAHTGTDWTAAFGGFAPGFSYLVGGDPRLRVSRRRTPRTSVPAGAVGLAGGFSGIYPRSSPGGWQLIGHTDLQLWDVDRDPPALLAPGTRVRFVEAAT